MKVFIKNEDKKINVKLGEIEEDRTEILSQLVKCKGGTCGCSSIDFNKIEDCTITNSKDFIEIDIIPKSDYKIDEGKLKECLKGIKKGEEL